jgi:C1A family cysteine protease
MDNTIMKRNIYVSLIAVTAASIFSIAAIVSLQEEDAWAQHNAGKAEWKPGGFIPPTTDLSHLRRTRVYSTTPLTLQPPVSWDWRALGGVTSVKDQNPYGTCWSFASIGDLESKILIDFAQTRDYSEHNIVACAPNQFYEQYGDNCNTGGNAYIATNYLFRPGSVDPIESPRRPRFGNGAGIRLL